MPIIPIITKSNPLAEVPDAVLDHQRRPTVDNRGLIQANQALADSQKMPELPADKLAAPYEALGAVGRAIAQTGSVLGGLALKMREAQTDKQVADGDNKMQQVLADHEQWKSDTRADPSTWSADLDTRLGSYREQLADQKDLNPAARDQLDLRLTRYEGMAKATVMKDAAKATFGQARDAFAGTVTSAKDTQDRPRFEEALQAGAAKGYFFPHEVEGFRQQYAETTVRKQGEALANQARQQHDWKVAEVGADPFAWKQKNPAPRQGEETEWKQFKGVAETMIRTGTVQVTNDVQQKILGGDFRVPAEIDAVQNRYFTPALRAAAKDLIAQGPPDERERQESGMSRAVELRQDLKDYDPKADADGAKYFALAGRIRRQADPRQAGELMQQLGQKYGVAAPQASPRPEAERQASAALDALFDPLTGAVPWKARATEWKDGQLLDKGVTIDPRARATAIERQARMETELRDWSRQNPQATPEEQRKKLFKVMGDGTRASAWEAMKSGLVEEKLPGRIPAPGEKPAYKTETLPNRSAGKRGTVDPRTLVGDLVDRHPAEPGKGTAPEFRPAK